MTDSPVLLLRNNDHYRRLAAFDLDADRLRVLHPLEARRWRRAPVVGHWAKLGKHSAALFSDGQHVWLWHDGERARLVRTSDARWHASDGHASLSISGVVGTPLSLEYETALGDSRAGDQQGQPNDEDLDFGLYVANVANDPERQQWLIDRAAAILDSRRMTGDFETVRPGIRRSIASVLEVTREPAGSGLRTRLDAMRHRKSTQH